jgi:hypothetical protein
MIERRQSIRLEAAPLPSRGRFELLAPRSLEEAAKTFTRMLWLNPSDNQGARFNLANIQAGRTWEQCEQRET